MESMAEIKRELIEYLADSPATDEEINKVKSNNTLSLPGRWETASAVLRDINEIVTYDLPDDYWDTYADSVRNLSAAQIVAAADAVIKPENLMWVEPRIRELELGEITLLDQDGNELSN
jgi:zinc protease